MKKINWLAVASYIIAFIALTYFNIFTTSMLMSMTEAELFENLIGTFVIFCCFHQSVASYLAIFSGIMTWGLWLAYIVTAIIVVNKWLKERRNDT